MIRTASYVAVLLAISTAGRTHGQIRPTSQEGKPAAVNWQEVHGANYIASYARNAAEVWSRFDGEIVDRELGCAQRLGLNSVRVWLDCRPYQTDPALMLSRIDQFLNLCAKHELRAMLVLFDSCGVEPDDFREHGETFDPHWRRWTANPGYDSLGPEHWEKLEAYVKDIVGAHLKDPRVLAWDVVNEPWAGKIWNDPQRKPVATRFVRHFCELTSGLNPEAPITVGVTFLERAELVEDLIGVISFHRYIGPNPDKWAAHLEEANQYAQLKGKPILLTEWGYPTWGAQRYAGRIITDDEQAKFYQEVLPVLMRSKIGWQIFDLMMGYGPFGRMSLFKPNGEPRPAAVVIEKHLKQGNRHE